jgi:hypothetical protein
MDSTIQVESFVDANTIAAHLKTTRRQVLEMTRRGVIPGYPLGAGSSRRVWRYKLSEIDACLTAVDRKKAPEAAFCQSAISSKINSGSPRSSQKGKL